MYLYFFLHQKVSYYVIEVLADAHEPHCYTGFKPLQPLAHTSSLARRQLRPGRVILRLAPNRSSTFLMLIIPSHARIGSTTF